MHDLVEPGRDSLAAFAEVQLIFRREGRAFQLPAMFLGREKRLAAAAVFAFCRMIREAIDVDDGEPAPSCGPTSLDARIEMFRERLEEIYSSPLELPPQGERTAAQQVIFAMARAIKRYEVPKQYFLEFAEARRMELSVKRYPTWNRLEGWLSRSSGAVGKIMCAILSVQSSDAAEFAQRYAAAMQLTSILMRLKENSQLGRIYLPLEDLARFGYSERDLSANVVNDKFRELMKFEVDRARSLFRQGADGLCWLPEDGSRLAAAALGTTWSAALDAIEAADYDVLSAPLCVSSYRRAMRIPAAWKLAKRFAGEPMPNVF